MRPGQEGERAGRRSVVLGPDDGPEPYVAEVQHTLVLGVHQNLQQRQPRLQPRCSLVGADLKQPALAAAQEDRG